MARKSDVEAFAAAALVLDVGIVELESLVQALAREVELGAVEIGQALGIDDHLHAVALEREIARVDRVGVLELVGHARAPRGAYAQAQPHPLAALGKEAGNVRRGAFCESDHVLVRLRPPWPASPQAVQARASCGSPRSPP